MENGAGGRSIEETGVEADKKKKGRSSWGVRRGGVEYAAAAAPNFVADAGTACEPDETRSQAVPASAMKFSAAAAYSPLPLLTPQLELPVFLLASTPVSSLLHPPARFSIHSASSGWVSSSRSRCFPFRLRSGSWFSLYK
uniref:Uncharacterized protein n=1 Tax=Oryza glumipatula TaxID=40148 RepID=A0A0D9Y2G8_9ORYZ